MHSSILTHQQIKDIVDHTVPPTIKHRLLAAAQARYSSVSPIFGQINLGTCFRRVAALGGYCLFFNDSNDISRVITDCHTF